MRLGKDILTGFLGAMLMEGVDIKKIDFDRMILYLDIPARSYSYDQPDSKIHNAYEYAKRIKETSNGLGIPLQSVKYKEKDIYWTKKMGDENYNKNIHSVLQNIGSIYY